MEDEEFPTCKESKLINVTDIKEKDYADLFVGMIPIGWIKLLCLYYDEIRAAGFTIANLSARTHKTIVPHPWNIYRALQLTPWWNVKVIIIGQDPYHLTEGSEPSATGASFECAIGTPIRKSLDMIFMRLLSTVEGFKIPSSGDLTKWMQQGVLMLNAALTTFKDEPGAHLNIWAFFPIRILQFLSKTHKNLVYMLWGKEAQSFKKYIEGDNLILESSHPTARGKYNNFWDINHFNECNNYLKEHNIEPINWILD